jgi:hypothetical protein
MPCRQVYLSNYLFALSTSTLFTNGWFLKLPKAVVSQIFLQDLRLQRPHNLDDWLIIATSITLAKNLMIVHNDVKK